MGLPLQSIEILESLIMASFKWRKKGSVTVPKGFWASGIASGIKKNGKHDSCLIFSHQPAVSAGVFTRNKAKAWPVLYCMKAIRNKVHQVILANSGNANCFNGPDGKKALEKSLTAISKSLNVPKREVLICSTGVIGRRFPIKHFINGIPELVRTLSVSGGSHAAHGILTTDTVTKELSLEFKIGKKKVCLGGIAKGAGMVHPNMATMLCFITTDLNITKSLLQSALKEAASKTFNRIAIDNDMSTNDTVFVLANGMAGNPLISRKNGDYKKFVSILTEFCKETAKKLVEDGEGVTRVCEIKIQKARNESDAETFARQVANSMLVKTMFTGADPNWGRIIGALGSCGKKIDWNKLKIYFDSRCVFAKGQGEVKNLSSVRNVLRKKYFTLSIILNQGKSEASFLTSDLTSKYVRINSAYTT